MLTRAVAHLAGQLRKPDNLTSRRPGRTVPRARKRGGSNRYPRREQGAPVVRTVTYSIVMYLLMGTAAWLVWREAPRPGARPAIALYAAQLACNVLWSFLFFGMRALDLAMLDLSVLWVLVVLSARAFHVVRPTAGWLLAPYLAWVTYAAGLNLSIWLRNG